MGDKMLDFISVENGVDILRHGERIFSLRAGDKPVYVGKGTNEYKMRHGSFKIKETASKPISVKLNTVELQNNVIVAKADEGEFKLTLTRDNHIDVHVDGFEQYNRLYIKLPAEKDEHVYGTGEIFTEFDLRGKKINCWVAEHINALQVGKKLVKQVFGFKNSTRKQKISNYETYYAQPTFLSSKKYYFHSFATARSEFDFENPDKHIIKIDEIADFCLGFGDTFEETVSDLTETLGRQPELPDWVYDGEILGIQGGTDVMMQKVETALNHNLAVSGVWIQDWEGRRVTAVGKQLFWNWQVDSELYPNLSQKIKKLNEHKIPTFGICLGHQLLALSCGASTSKLKFGHRGANQPARDSVTGRTYVTSQNHGYAVVASSLPSSAVLRYSNANDKTAEGIDYTDKPAFSVQFHPEACGGPHDTNFLFDRFMEMIENNA